MAAAVRLNQAVRSTGAVDKYFSKFLSIFKSFAIHYITNYSD